tara:strand:+ start:5515 stop:5715 length:201 start_codon:yes stop_codon:yes gene_type:complete
MLLPRLKEPNDMIVDEKVRIEKLRLALQDIADVSSLGLEGGTCVQWLGRTAREALEVDDEDQQWGN